MIETINLTKEFYVGKQTVKAIDNVNIKFEKNKIYAITGKSGSGKSTMLNVLAGIVKPTKGNVKIGNIYLDKLNEKKLASFRRKYTGFIFQSYNLMPYLTALENVEMPLAFQGMSQKNRTIRAKQILEMVGLKERVNHRPNELSGGEQQRVAIARALVNKSKILYADEPTGNLDTQTTYEILELMKHVVDTTDKTLLIVSHDIEVLDISHYKIEMQDGKIIKNEKIRRNN